MQETVSIADALDNACAILAAVSECARLEAEILIARSIDVPRAYLYAHPEDRLDPAAAARLAGVLERRLSGEPMAYITGAREFWSLTLSVSPATLVPRPETELVVELALRELPRSVAKQVLDLGTGCGAIAVAIARERPLTEVTAVDLSDAALAIARQNIRQLDLANVTCVKGDWTNPVRDRRFDLIASNPPYIAAGDAVLQALRSEPLAALAAGEDGLDAIRILARDCLALTHREGILLLEHGETQADPVAQLLSTAGWRDIRCHRDLAGKPRVTRAVRP